MLCECTVSFGTLILSFPSVLSLVTYLYLCKFTKLIVAIDVVARIIHVESTMLAVC